MMQIIITSPSLNEKQNVSGISTVTKFIITNNSEHEYVHFELGKKDKEKGGIYRIGSIIKSLRLWKNLLKKSDDCLIHYNFPLSKMSIFRDPIFILFAKLYHKPIVIHIHGGNFLTAPSVPFILNRILKSVFSLPYPLIVLSELEREIIRKRYRKSLIHVLPNCIDLHDAANFHKNNSIETSSHTLVIGYLGRIAESKGMCELLAACTKLKKENIPFVLHLAGQEEKENQFLPQFRDVLKEQFVYDGIVSGETKSNFLQKLDLFILPSYFEGLPMSLLECMSFGVVPITTDVGSISTVVTNETNGFFIPTQDYLAIYKVIKDLTLNRENLTTMSRNARKTIFEKFNPQQYMERLNSIYDEAINLKRR